MNVKRRNNSIQLSSNSIIVDVEGTTTSITFVKDVLFPYVRKHLEDYVKDNWDSESFQAILSALRVQANEDKASKLDGVVEIPEDSDKDALIKAVIENVLWQMEGDRKTKSLKDLQGLIMASGYDKGELRGHVYDDFEPNLKLWTQLGKSVYIYSSGSVHAQKLLYGHSEKGDLLPFIKGHFDTTVGKKDDAESYKKISEQISCPPSETVFFTDVPKEAKAAKETGMLAILLSRDGNAPLTNEDKEGFQVITSFSEVQFENVLKKRKFSAENDENDDNKSVELCDVSVKSPKELTNTPVTQQHDIKMDIEESSIQETICNGKTSVLESKDENKGDNSLQPNLTTENNDIEMNLPNDISEGKKSEKDVEGGESVGEKANKPLESEILNKDLNVVKISKEIMSGESEIVENENQEKNNKSDETCALIDKREEEANHKTNENPGDDVIIACGENQILKEKTPQNVNQDSKETVHDTISEYSENKTQNQMTTENCEDIQHNGGLAHVSSENEPDKDVIQNSSDAKTVMETSSEKPNDQEPLITESKTKEIVKSQPDSTNPLDSQVEDNNVIGENTTDKDPELIKGNGTEISTSKADDGKDTDVNHQESIEDKPSLVSEPKNIEKLTSNQDHPEKMETVDESNGISRENGESPPNTVIQDEKKAVSNDMDNGCVNDSTVKQVDELKMASSNEKDDTNTAGKECELIKSNGTEISSKADADTKPNHHEATEDKISLVSESGNIEKVTSNQDHPEKMETGDESNGISRENGESPPDTVVQAEKKAVTDDMVSVKGNETETKGDAMDTNLNHHEETEDKPSLVKEPEHIEKFTSKQDQPEKMETGDGSNGISRENGDFGNDRKSEEEIKLKSSSNSAVEAENKVVSNNVENGCLKDNTEKSEEVSLPQLSQTNDDKVVTESNCDFSEEEAVCGTDIKNNVNTDDSNPTVEKKEDKISVNDKVNNDENTALNKDDEDMKNKVDETSVSDIKKCDVPENITAATIVEA